MEEKRLKARRPNTKLARQGEGCFLPEKWYPAGGDGMGAVLSNRHLLLPQPRGQHGRVRQGQRGQEGEARLRHSGLEMPVEYLVFSWQHGSGTRF